MPSSRFVVVVTFSYTIGPRQVDRKEPYFARLPYFATYCLIPIISSFFQKQTSFFLAKDIQISF